ncbi:type II toxin-antitoxin system HicB family antitoxin [Candidatus Poribacteria bacterium]|nr:type II toxin-antitoxin system HicB family antitoxin [Candidatus Poribacteria bacterium]
MNRKSPRRVALREYVAEVLKSAIYEKGEVLDVVVAEAPDLPGCFTQGASFEGARENLIDAIEVWILAGPALRDPRKRDLQSGEELPVVNNYQLAITMRL